ncbi:beta-galactosidase [Glycomyces dulcitolivorans]|uniref:beta-galactosidase n=1 Tax=Glycomyces dulcitolivorans TaxID=2200759 RepID=UPI0013003CFE|nr:beta-galactosidase [Glycomyces dulcitolivorans]
MTIDCLKERRTERRASIGTSGHPHFLKHALRFTNHLTRHYADHPAPAAFGIDNEPGDG